MNTRTLTPVKLVFCGPSDVEREIIIGKEIVDHWNHLNSEARGLLVQHLHWQTDIYPDLSDRAQNVVNRQLIDESRILVAVFWSRFGTPTGVAASGTQEEILRAANLGRKVMVYFSNLEQPSNADAGQLELLWQFRQSLRLRGIGSSFSSRNQFRKNFETHLALALNAIDPIPQRPRSRRKRRPTISQKAETLTGNNYQHVGDIHNYAHPPTVKVIRERRPGSVTTEEVSQINEWIRDLAEGEVTKTRSQAFPMFGALFKNYFGLGHREDLPSTKMPLAEDWYHTQKALQKEGLKSKAPDLYRNRLIGSIKAAMKQMGLTNETYYPILSTRLKMKKSFGHLPDLTTINLKRVYNMVRGDVKKWRG